jgi:hypothetical protein
LTPPAAAYQFVPCDIRQTSADVRHSRIQLAFEPDMNYTFDVRAQNIWKSLALSAIILASGLAVLVSCGATTSAGTPPGSS